MRFLSGLGLVVLSSVLAAAPVPKAAKKTDYFPLALGTKWEYVEGDDVKTTEVVGVDVQKDGTYVTLTYKGEKTPPPTLRRVFKFVDGDVFSLKTENSEAEKPALIMKSVVRPDQTWNTEHQWKGGELWTIQYKVGAAKAIKTPAGEFTALPVVSDNSRTGKETRWYAAGVGLVRKDAADGTVLSELKSFKAGK
ncbi:MAG: hypothetical protein KF873_23285 [Gemmataceae bacterium]|nr:hypothetical protein [Gemmataceae bacterium]